jgi:mRNA interferase RelE/StbE
LTWRLEFSERAGRDLRRLDRSVAVRVVLAIERLAANQGGDVRRLRGERDVWRLRVGDWRVRFRYEYAERIIRVQRVLRRDEAYRD